MPLQRLTTTELLSSISASAVFISEGMHRGWSAPTLPKLQSENSTIKISSNDPMGLEAVYFAGELLSIPLSVYLIDRIGRKKSILINSALGMVAWLLIAVAGDVVLLYIARLLAGVTGNISMIAVPIYISETTNSSARNVFLGMVSFAQTLGILLIYSLVPFVPFYVPSLVAEVVLVSQLVVFSFMPESPYYLILQGEETLARDTLKRLRGSYHQDEFNEILLTVSKPKERETQYQKLHDLCTEKSNRRALVLATILYACLQFSGFSVILMNVDGILTATKSIYLDASIAEIIFAVLVLTGNFLCLICVNILGKKKMLLLSSVTATICFLTLGVYFHFLSLNIDVISVSWVSTAAVSAYAVCFFLGLGSLTEPMAAELFATGIRATGTTYMNAVDSCFGMLSILLYNLLISEWEAAAYYFFAVVNLASSFFIFFVVPETNGKSLHQIHDELEK